MIILAWIVSGITAGYLAKRVIPGQRTGGILGDLVVGVTGALVGGLVGGWFFNLFGHPEVVGNIYSAVVAFLGALIFLWTIRLLTKRRARI